MTRSIKSNLGTDFLSIAKNFAAFPAFMSEHRTLTYDEFSKMITSFAVQMRIRGIDRESMVALNTGDAAVAMATLFATSMIGSQFVVANRTLAEVRPFRPTHFLKTIEAAGNHRVPFETIDESWLNNPESGAISGLETFSGCKDPNDPWLNLHTTGTTGTPKYINLSQKIVFDRTMAISHEFNTKMTTMATLFKYTARPFFARAFGILFNGGAIVDSPNPDTWKAYGVNFVCGSPAAAQKFFLGKKARRPIARLEVSGAKLQAAAARELLEHFDVVEDCYGASETNKFYSQFHSKCDDGEICVQGKKLDSQVEIVDDSGKICMPGQIGSVRIKNNYMVHGYLNDQEAGENSFRDGWFYTRDIAEWGPKDTLRVLSRDVDSINLGGPKVNSALVDMVLVSAPGIRAAACFKNPKAGAADELLAFVEVEDLKTAAFSIQAAKEACLSKLGFAFAPRNIRMTTAIPRNEDGTPNRQMCQELVLAATKVLGGIQTET